MKRGIIAGLALIMLLSSFVSAGMVITQQPKEFYNMGEIISIPIKINTATGIAYNVFSVELICNGIETEIWRQPIVNLQAGEEREIVPSVPLITSLVGKTTGICRIKAILGEEYKLTNEFEISDSITLKLTTESREFEPGKDIILEGEAVKKNGEAVNGIVELKVISEGSAIAEIINSVKNGYFFLNFSMPKETKSQQYLVNIYVYENDIEGNASNKGVMDVNILIKQIPTTLEIFFEDSEIEPGTNLKVKAILHDQTGEKISSNSIITIKDKTDVIREQKDKPTDEFLEFPTAYNEPPSEWKVVAVSSRITAESTFKILEKKSVNLEILNKTLLITNTGNVPYNDSIMVKIGNKSQYINVSLTVDESRKYVMSAPSGEYEIEISTKEGSKITGMAALTGKKVDVKEFTGTWLNKNFFWIFLSLILGLVAFLFFRRIRKRKFFGFMFSKKKARQQEPQEMGKEQLVNSGSKAELSLSIKGDRQDASIVCLKLKNFEEIKNKREGAKDTLQKIRDAAEKNKAVIYENQNFIFFILAPLRTKTFENEKAALDIASKIRETITEHNKIFKPKIDFGVSVSMGGIIAKQEEVFRFASIGALITSAKKIASLSDGEIFLSERINERILRYAKTDRQRGYDTPIYKIREMKNDAENEKFIRGFLKRIGNN